MIEVFRGNVKTLITRGKLLQDYAIVYSTLFQKTTTFVNVNFVYEDMQDLLSKDESALIFVSCEFMNCSFLNLSRVIRNLNFFNCAFNDCEMDFSEKYAYRFLTCTFREMKVSRDGHSQWPRYYECSFYDVVFEDSNDYSKLDTIFSNCSYTNCLGPVPFRSRCPVEGSFIAYKAIIGVDRFSDKRAIYVAKLLIPKDASRLSAGGSKCRASKAKVLDILDLKGIPLRDEALFTHYFGSIYERFFEYRKGCIVKSVNEFDSDQWAECSSGIHFFMTFEEAASYMH